MGLGERVARRWLLRQRLKRREAAEVEHETPPSLSSNLRCHYVAPHPRTCLDQAYRYPFMQKPPIDNRKSLHPLRVVKLRGSMVVEATGKRDVLRRGVLVIRWVPKERGLSVWEFLELASRSKRSCGCCPSCKFQDA